MSSNLDDLVNSLKPNDSIFDIGTYNHTELLFVIINSGRYDLLSNNEFNLSINDDEISLKLLDKILKDEDVYYYLKQRGFRFKISEIKAFRELYLKYYKLSDYEMDNFIYCFFEGDEFNQFIAEHRNLFMECARNHDVSYLNKYSEYIDIKLSLGQINTFNNLLEFSVDNYKKLVNLIKEGVEIKTCYGNSQLLNRLFENKSSFSKDEFCILLNLLQDSFQYKVIQRGEHIDVFSKLVNYNLDYLMECVIETGVVPRCLRESDVFRQACIESNRMYLAVQCLIPDNLLGDDVLLEKYAIELKINKNVLRERLEMIDKYSKLNGEVYLSMIASSLKDELYDVSKEHYERFINDINIQVMISSFNQQEIKVFHKILEIVDYENYDASFMLYKVIKNIQKYSQLINSIDVNLLDTNLVCTLLVVLQDSTNHYVINSFEDLCNFNAIKRHKIGNIVGNDINLVKEELIRYLFNIDMDEAVRINNAYCMDRGKDSLLEILSKSELPQNIIIILCVLNNIVESNSIDFLNIMVSSNIDNKIYNSFLPLDVYLRKEYANLYDKSVYKVGTREDVKETLLNYKGNNVDVYIPTSDISFMVHCVGNCSLAEDVTDSNFYKDWVGRPQMQDHFVACSYINQETLNNMITSGKVVFGFSTLEGGSIYGMGPRDIDSIGDYAKTYNCSYTLMKGNGVRANILPPSVMIDLTQSYNEIVIERRNNKSDIETKFKREPNYIVLTVDTLDDSSNFKTLDEVIERKLSFLSEDEIEIIKSTSNSSDIKEIISKHVKEIYENLADPQINENALVNSYVNGILKTLHYEQSVRAATEFGIPIVVVDKLYYFKKMIGQSDLYTEEQKNILLEMYVKSNDNVKRRIWESIRFNKDFEAIDVSINGKKINHNLNVVL